MKDRMILVVGRTASGKDTIVEKLEGAGFKSVLSYTTRPSRGPEDRHIFITEDEAAKYTDRAAETVINGHQYFTTREQLKECDIYIVDPNGVYELLFKYPNIKFTIVYVLAGEDVRKSRYMSRQATKDVEEEFEERNSSEGTQFSDFENWVWDWADVDLPNLDKVYLLDNNGSPDALNSNFEWLLSHLQ